MATRSRPTGSARRAAAAAGGVALRLGVRAVVAKFATAAAALEGKGPKATKFDPSKLMAKAAVAEVNRPRPAATRYPISMEQYLELKQRSETQKPPRKSLSAVSTDSPIARPRSRGPVTGALAASAPPTAAPNPGLSFPSITATPSSRPTAPSPPVPTTSCAPSIPR